MHRFATSKMKIELPWRCVPPPPIVADVGRDRAHAHVLELEIVVGRLAVLLPAAQHMLDAGLGPVGEMGRMRPVHRHDVGQDRRLDVVVVVGRDAHQLRALDQEGRVADVVDAYLAFLQRGEAKRGRNDARPVLRDQARTGLDHLGLCGQGAAPCAKAASGDRKMRPRTRTARSHRVTPLQSSGCLWIAQKPRERSNAAIRRSAQSETSPTERVRDRERGVSPAVATSRSGAPCWLSGLMLNRCPCSGRTVDRRPVSSAGATRRGGLLWPVGDRGARPCAAGSGPMRSCRWRVRPSLRSGRAAW